MADKSRRAYFKEYCRKHAAHRAATSRKWRREHPKETKEMNKEQYQKRKREGKT